MNPDWQGSAIAEPILAQRRRQIRRWVVIWRFMTVLCIPALAWVNPEKLGSLPRTFIVFSLAVAYTVIHGFLITAMSDKARQLQFIDLAACALLMLAAGEPKVVFIMTMFSCSTFLAYNSLQIRDWLPESVFLSVIYLAANDLAGIAPWETIKGPSEVGVFVLIYFFGLGFMIFNIILDRLSSLELEGFLEQQRQGYRQRLHDDLGNTLCGLHFKIETLKHLDRRGVRQALYYLAGGYKRAVQVLGNIVGGIEDVLENDVDESLMRIKTGLEHDTGVGIELSGTAAGANLIPEFTREALAIVREAALNACKHSGADKVTISVARRRRCLCFTVADDGCGFNEERLNARQKAGHVGVKGMYERASLIGANFETNSVPGQGTRVELNLKIPLRTRFGRFLEQDPRQTGKLFSLLVFLKIPVLLLVLVQIGMVSEAEKNSITGLLIAGGLTLDCIFWVAFRPLLYQWLRHRPRLIILNFVYFAGVFYVGQKYGYAMHFFYVVYPEAGLMMSGLVLGTRNNLLLALSFSLAIIASYFVAAPDPSAVSHDQLLEDLIIFIVAVLAIAFPCGLAGDFVKRLEREKLAAISRSLKRERERLTMETHHQLHDLITALGETLGELAHTGSTMTPSAAELDNVKALSRDLKTRLRSIIVTLESPPAAGE